MNIRWITRLSKQAHLSVISQRCISQQQHLAGVETDTEVLLGFPQKKTEQVKARIISYTDPISQKHLKFLTNDFYSEPHVITQLYAKRWNIELLFKKLKQNMPLQYFLGDNKNAIQIQIWCALIADLLLNVIRRQVKRKWAFSTLVSLVRLHLFNYLNLYSFLENPERCVIRCDLLTDNQLNINLSG